MSLLGPDGKPVGKALQYKKAPPPKLGEAFGWSRIGNVPAPWSALMQMGVFQFNLDLLTLDDYRVMRDHYQINASLSVLTFMMHQLDWRIDCDNKKIADHCEANLKKMWTRLVRGMGQSFWAGFSPQVLQWENDTITKTVQLTKVKDLNPLDCEVNWKEVEGWAPPGRVPPKYKVYDGIKQIGLDWPIPVENSYWYPLLMENGNYGGTKLLRKAFVPWYFSTLIHLFVNRYFERFGEPVPVGYASFEEQVQVSTGETMRGVDYMQQALQNLRNRSTVVLPNDKLNPDQANSDYEYEIKYLESQMRGADFERYLLRLDEEISLSLFTPLLMMRTSDVGSYSLGDVHSSTYGKMLNAIAGDWAEYINKYVLRRMVDFNFSATAPEARIIFRPLGGEDMETMRAVVAALVSRGMLKPDIEELGQIVGLSLTEIKQVTQNDPNADPNAPKDNIPPQEGGVSGGIDLPNNKTDSSDKKSKNSKVGEVIELIRYRVEQQITKAFSDRNGDLSLSLGYKRKLIEALEADGYSNPTESALQFYKFADSFLSEVKELGTEAYSSKEALMKSFDLLLEHGLTILKNDADE